MILFGFALLVAYVPVISGAGTSPRWAVIALAAAVAVITVRRVRITWAALAGILFVAWACASLLWSVSVYSPDAGWKLLALAALFALGASLTDLRGFWRGAALGVAVSSALVTIERLTGWHLPSEAPPAGLFVNYLFMAEAAAMVLAVCIARRWWWLAAAVAPSLLLVPLARGPLVALGVAGLIWLRGRSGLWAFAGALLMVALVVPLMIWLRPESVAIRLTMWQDALSGVSLTGWGYGSYFTIHPFMVTDWAGLRPDHAHNDLLELGVTVGLVGAGLAGLFVVALMSRFSASSDAGKWAIVVFLMEGFFGFPLSLPATAGMFALAAGHLSRGLPALWPRADGGGGPFRSRYGGAGP